MQGMHRSSPPADLATRAMITARFAEAAAYACTLHADQRRKGSDTPYVAHLLAVASLVLEHGGTEDEAIAALLHDAIEDQGGAETRDEIARRFGVTVAEIVEGCTDNDPAQPDRPREAQSWHDRKRAHLAHLKHANASVRLVVAADKLHNANSLLRDFDHLGEALWSRFRASKHDIRWYYEAMVEILLERGPTPLVLELQRVVSMLSTRIAAPTTTR
jgi:GTP pyrophosphokinase